MALNKITCENSDLPFEECNCLECQEDRKLQDRMKANGYVLDAADKNEVL